MLTAAWSFSASDKTLTSQCFYQFNCHSCSWDIFTNKIKIHIKTHYDWLIHSSSQICITKQQGSLIRIPSSRSQQPIKVRQKSQGCCFLVTWVHSVYMCVNQKNKHKFCKAWKNINNQKEAMGISEKTWIFWVWFLHRCSRYRWCQSFPFFFWSTWLRLRLLRPLSSRCNIDIGQLLGRHGCLATGPISEPGMTVTTGVWEGTDKTVLHTHTYTQSDLCMCASFRKRDRLEGAISKLWAAVPLNPTTVGEIDMGILPTKYTSYLHHIWHIHHQSVNRQWHGRVLKLQRCFFFRAASPSAALFHRQINADYYS